MGAFSSCLLSLNLKADAFSSSLGRKHVLEKNTGMHLVPKQEVNFMLSRGNEKSILIKRISITQTPVMEALNGQSVLQNTNCLLEVWSE